MKELFSSFIISVYPLIPYQIADVLLLVYMPLNIVSSRSKNARTVKTVKQIFETVKRMFSNGGYCKRLYSYFALLCSHATSEMPESYFYLCAWM